MKRKTATGHHSKKNSIRLKTKSIGFSIHKLLGVLGFTVVALTVFSRISYTQEFLKSNVLGDDTRSEQQKQQQEQNSQNKQVNIQQNEAEVQNPNGSTLKVKLEDNGALKVEGEAPGDVHYIFQSENGETQLEAVSDRGEKLSTATAEIRRLEKSLEDKDIAVSSEDGVLEVEHNGMKARTSFPLSLNPTTNQLVITTSEGTRTVAVLPDDAIRNIFTNGLLSTVINGLGTINASSPSGTLQLSMHNGEAVYEIQGTKTQKLLGIFPVTTDRSVLVSAQDGQTVAQVQSWLATLVSLLSF